MAALLLLLLAVLAASSTLRPAGAQDADWEAEPCLGCDEEEALVSKRSVPISLVAAGMLSRRSALDNNFMRFGRSAPPRVRETRNDNYVRFGRSPVNDEFDRTVRGDPKENNNGFLRFGRSRDSYMRFGRAKDSFMRFGRAPDVALHRPASSDEDDDDTARDSFMRFGRSVGSGSGSGAEGIAVGAEVADQTNTTEAAATRPEKRAAHKTENLMRFGRSKDNYMRFGRAKDNYMRFGRGKDNYMRFGRGRDDFMRFGRKDDFMRFGRKDDFMRFGRSEGLPDDESENREPDAVASHDA